MTSISFCKSTSIFLGLIEIPDKLPCSFFTVINPVLAVGSGIVIVDLGGVMVIKVSKNVLSLVSNEKPCSLKVFCSENFMVRLM
jgi:hypothetical protein